MSISNPAALDTFGVVKVTLTARESKVVFVTVGIVEIGLLVKVT
jgi:hypothetical protein